MQLGQQELVVLDDEGHHGPRRLRHDDQGRVVVSASVPKVGAIVVNDQGRTVYTLTDAAGKAVACTGGCLTAWPPVLVVAPATATGSGGVKGVATVTTSDGDQVTINGLPVYTFSGDPGSGRCER